MILKCLINLIGSEGLSIFDIPIVPVVTAASVFVTPFLKGVVPLLDSNHLVERIDIYIGPIASGDVNQFFSQPVSLVDHILFSPIYSVLPVTDHLPGSVLDFIRNLTWFDVNTSIFICSISGKSSPVFNIFFVDEVFSPSDRVVSCP